jgi:hypothetical protein
MATHSVRLDKETERVLSEVQAAMGLSSSAAIKSGLRALHTQVCRTRVRTPYEVFRELDLGPGGQAIGTSADTRRAVRSALKSKLGR